MNLSTVLHHQASYFAEQADMAKAKRLPVDYKELYGKAYVLEKEAALKMPLTEQYPMPRAYLMGSAAALAYKAGNYSEAEKMIALARSEKLSEFEAGEFKHLEKLVHKAISATSPNGDLQVKGTLVEAKADEREIKIRDAETSQLHSFTVPAKMFKKIVKEYWQDVVSAVGKASSQGVFTLEKISPAN